MAQPHTYKGKIYTYTGLFDHELALRKAAESAARKDVNPLTLRNYQNSLFINRLPLEIQLMILKFAMGGPVTIRPYQVTEFSNRFFWNEYTDQLPLGYEIVGTLVRKPRNVLEFTKLLSTCRHFYHILGDRDLYGLHTFTFKDQGELHTFLAAITPGRRQQIQKIVLDAEREIYRETWYGSDDPISQDLKLRPDLIPLLVQCRLKTLTIRFDFRLSPVDKYLAELLIQLQRIHELYSAADEHLILSLPCTRIALGSDMSNFIPLWNAPWADVPDSPMMEVASPSPEKYLDLEHWNITTMIKDIRNLYAAHQQRLQQRAEKKLDVYSTTTWLDLNQALKGSKVTFPGEIRVERTEHSQQYTYFEGHFSHRARRGCVPEEYNIFQWGFREKAKLERNSENMKDCRFSNIISPDWAKDDDSRIELYMSWAHSFAHMKTEVLPWTSPMWTREDIEMIDGHYRLSHLLDLIKGFNDIFFERDRLPNAPLQESRHMLERIETHPGPGDVQAALQPLIWEDDEVDFRLRNGSFLGGFAQEELRRQRLITGLKRHIARLEALEAEKQAEKEAVPAAAATTAVPSTTTITTESPRDKKRTRKSAIFSPFSDDSEDSSSEPEPKRPRRSPPNK